MTEMKTSNILATVLIFVVLSYVIFPVVFVLPARIVFGKTPAAGVFGRVKDAYQLFFTPIKHLEDRFPLYRKYILFQENLIKKL